MMPLWMNDHRRIGFATVHAVLLLGLACFDGPPARVFAQTTVATDTVAGSSVVPLGLDSIFHERSFIAAGSRATWRQHGEGYELVAPIGERGVGVLQMTVDPGAEPQIIIAPEDLIPAGQKSPLGIDGYQYSKDGQKVLIFTRSERVWRLRTRGDYWVLDLRTKSLQQIGVDFPASSLMFAKFSPDSTAIFFVHQGDLYWEPLATGQPRRLTIAANEAVTNGTFDWVYEEEFALRDGYRIHPQGNMLAYWQIDCSPVGRFPLLNTTQQLYPSPQWIPYPKVGTANPIATIGILHLQTGETHWVALPGDPQEHYIHAMDWIPGSDSIAIKQFNRLQNTCRIYIANVSSGEVRLAHTETTQTWLEPDTDFLWLEPGKTLLYLSEHDGWSQISLANLTTGETSYLTGAKYDVIRILKYSIPGQKIYFLASPDNATQRYLFQLDLATKTVSRLTPQEESGTHDYQFSSDGDYAIETYSNANTPPVTRIIRTADQSVVKLLESNQQLSSRLALIPMPGIEFFQIKTEDGVVMDGWKILPPNMDTQKKYPLIVHVYGEPAGTTVNDIWGGDRALWHRYLATLGYVVMSIDNRGTPAPKGTEWRKSVYRQIGTLASADQAAGLKAFLSMHPFIDDRQVGIWGWSGGGSMTLNALFRYPQLYQSGVSIAPVPNQLYYDTIYQERYMGLPQDNEEGYRIGSPITHAANLQGSLLLIHGTGDDNCHYQTSELLINELIRLNKKFSMFAYPNRSHSVSEGENTTRHLFQLITDHFLQTIKPATGPAPVDGVAR